MKVFVVLYYLQDDDPQLLGVYSSYENADKDWGKFIERLEGERWKWCQIFEVELDSKRYHLGEFGELEEINNECIHSLPD